MPQDESGKAMPRCLYCLTMSLAQLPYEELFRILGMSLRISVVLRHVGQAMHDANDLIPPPMHRRPFRQLPEDDCRGYTLLEAAKLPQEG